MNGRKMHKLFNTLILGVTAIFLSASYSVYANEQEIIKCTRRDGTVVFQDFACKNAKREEVIVINEPKPNRNSGLRDYEKVVLQRSAQRQSQERQLRALIEIAKIKRFKRRNYNIDINSLSR